MQGSQAQEAQAFPRSTALRPGPEDERSTLPLRVTVSKVDYSLPTDSTERTGWDDYGDG